MARSLSAVADMETTRSSCGRRRPENASTPWKATGTFVGLCYCVGKTVKVTVLPTALPRSAGERRSRPLHMCYLTFEKMVAISSPASSSMLGRSSLGRMTTQSSCGASQTASASGLLPDIGEPANPCSSSVGKTVEVTVLPTPTPRSAGERRRTATSKSDI
jgi:hypothetical protein